MVEYRANSDEVGRGREGETEGEVGDEGKWEEVVKSECEWEERGGGEEEEEVWLQVVTESLLDEVIYE